MAKELEHPAQTAQHGEDANEEIVESKELLERDTDGHEEQGEASSGNSHPQHETSSLHEDEAGRTTPPCSPEVHASPQAFRCWHESSRSSEIEDFIYEPAQPSAQRSRLFMPQDSDFGAWGSPSDDKCPASFGDHGTTATAGAMGQLVQFSDYLGAGNSGMFSAAYFPTNAPYLVPQRARNLHAFALEAFFNETQRLESFFALSLGLELLGNAQPRLKWFQYQWPRYEYRRRCFKGLENIGLTIQFIVRNRTVLQQYILENWGETDVDLDLTFLKEMSIWDLDHVKGNCEFNKTTPDDQNAGPGPGGFSWVHVKRFRKVSPGARTDSQPASHKTKSNSSHDNGNKKDQPKHGVALVISVAVNGEMIRFSPGQSPHTWKQTLKAKSSAPGYTSQVLEIVTAYKLVLLENPFSDWKTFVVPLKEMDPSRFLREAKAASLFRTSITRISGRDNLGCSDGKRNSKALKCENECEVGIVNVSQDRIATVDSKPQVEPLPATHHNSTPEKTSPGMDRIEFAIRRNLLHILGVCAIPVTVRISGEKAKGRIWEKLRNVEPIALSCGDLSGHRICTTSSFFAFQFLAEVAKRLSRLPQPDRNETHAQTLLSRIRDVCLGHLKWLYAAEKTDQDEAFRSLYWPTGEAVILPKSYRTWAPREHVRHTAFQILKALEFANTFHEDEDGDSSLDEGVKVFRLDDHVWIWRALKAIEDEIFGARAILAQRDGRRPTTDSEVSNTDGILRLRGKVASRTVQREVLRKFTAEHEILRKKMVAVTRSPRETRFLFHARDTALLYGQDMGFFPEDASFREVWNNTIDAQRLHEHNQEARWDNTLRYALSIMLGIRGHQINNRRPGDMVRSATEVLLRSSSANGLFPGKLDIVTKGPPEDVFHMEENADSHYGAGFEIPYVFLIHAEAIGAIIDNSAKTELEAESEQVNLRLHPTGRNRNSTEAMPAHHTSNPQLEVQVGQREEDEELRKLLAKLTDVLSALPYLPNSTSASDYTASGEVVADARLALKKTIPFSNIIDSHNIVEIEDEWLFNYPHFFDSHEGENISIHKTLDSLEDSKATWPTAIDVAEMRQKYSFHDNEDDSSVEPTRVTIPFEILISVGGTIDCGFIVMDVPSRRRLQGKGVKNLPELQMGSYEFIWKRISRPRTVSRAKKRWIHWEPRGTAQGLEAALLCYAASKGDERANMLDFFERYFTHETVMFDHCDLAHNTWDTELHLSFFILGDASAPLSGNTALKKVEGFPGVQGKHISRGSVGIRFHGDAFDRYWTLHTFTSREETNLPGNESVPGRFADDGEGISTQRKVLELELFCNMLHYVKTSTEQILAEVKSEMGIRSGAFSWSIPTMDTYSSWSKLWEGFAPLLQALADDLTSAQDIIGQWEAREDARGQERPRWTHNDERKYRAAITRVQRLVKWCKKEIKDLLDEVKSLQELCTARLANAREELSFRSNQNIASFTYVTIVFLPLGFAASVFSMNGYPAGGWVASMAVIAVVALTITVIALANTKLLLTVADEFSRDAMRITRAVFQSSLIGQHKHQQDERVEALPVPNKSAHGDQKAGDSLHSHATRHVLFWMAYLLIELPARRVALACRALPGSLTQSLGLLRPDATPPASVGSTGGSTGPRAAAVGRKIIRIAGGILILPLLLISWTIQLLFYNIFDILAFLGRLTRKTFYALVIPSDANRAATDTKMVTWLIKPPSSLRPVRKYMSRDEKSEKPTPQAEAPVAVDRSDSGPVEDV